MKKILLISSLLLGLNLSAQSIISVTPDYGNAGQIIPVTIAGANTNFSTATDNPSFVFSQGTATELDFPFFPNVIDDLTVTDDMNVNLQGTSSNPSGFFNLFFNQGSLISLPNAFFVNNSLGGSNSFSATIVLGGGKKLGEGDPMVYSKIFLENMTTFEVLQVGRTNSDGLINFDNIPDGSYHLHINDHNNQNPYRLDVGENYISTDLIIQFKDDHLVSGIDGPTFDDKFNFMVFPSVFTHNVSLELTLNQTEDVLINIFNINGEKISELNKSKVVGKTNIDLSSLFSGKTKGIYFVETQIGKHKRTVKLIKQ